MQSFSFSRFVVLLVRILEVTTITTLASRWIAILFIIRYRSAVAHSVIDVSSNFVTLAILLLLVGDLWLLFTRRPRAVFGVFRTLVYIIVFMVGRYRLGGSSASTAQRPNQAMQLTAGRAAF